MTASEKVQTPGNLLLGAGCVLLVYNVFYAGWTTLSLVMSLASLGMRMEMVVDALTHGDFAMLATMLGPALWVMLIQGLQLLLHLILLAPSAYIVRSALRFKRLESLTGARRSRVLLVAVPLLGLVLGLIGAVLSFNCCGLFMGAFPSLAVTILGGVAAFLVHQALEDPEVVAAFPDGPA